MSFNKIISHSHDGYVELVIDGYEDWDSAVDSISEMADVAERDGLSRFLIDFRRVDMRVSPSEAPDIAKFFNSFCTFGFSLGLILPEDRYAARTAQAFAEAIAGLGHPVAFLATPAERAAWVAHGSARARRTGTA